MSDPLDGWTVHVRKAGPADMAQAFALSRAAFQTLRSIYRPTGDAALRQAARAEEGTRWIAEHEGRIVGTVQAADHKDHIHLMGLAVHPDHQRLGVARSLVEHLVREAPGRGFCVVALDTIRETGNVPIFERLGFMTVSESPAAWCVSETYPSLHDMRMERRVGEGG